MVEARKFQKRWQFSQCCGAVDRKQVRIQVPPGTGSQYFNYKGFFSVILFAVINAEYDFIYVNIGANGRAGDAGLWNQCSFKNALEEKRLNMPENHVILGDEAFPLKPYLMKPFSRKRAVKRREKIFNYRLSRACRIVENAFGILAWRFRIFQWPMECKIETINKIIWAICSLHN